MQVSLLGHKRTSLSSSCAAAAAVVVVLSFCRNYAVERDVDGKAGRHRSAGRLALLAACVRDVRPVDGRRSAGPPDLPFACFLFRLACRACVRACKCVKLTQWMLS